MLGKQIKVAAYAHRLVANEGMRRQLLINPKPFTTNQEVISHLEDVLPTWGPIAEPPSKLGLQIDIEYEKIKIKSERHDYRLLVLVTNNSSRTFELGHIDVEFPSDLAVSPEEHPMHDPDRSNSLTIFFRAKREDLPEKYYPGDKKVGLKIDYFVDQDIFENRGQLFDRTVKATGYSLDDIEPPLMAEKPIAQLQIF